MELLKEHLRNYRTSLSVFIKWFFMSMIIGISVGIVSIIFAAA